MDKYSSKSFQSLDDVFIIPLTYNYWDLYVSYFWFASEENIRDVTPQVEKLKLIVIFYPDLSIACSAFEFFGKEGS